MGVADVPSGSAEPSASVGAGSVEVQLVEAVASPFAANANASAFVVVAVVPSAAVVVHAFDSAAVVAVAVARLVPVQTKNSARCLLSRRKRKLQLT